jgi:hypothetical protein
MNRGRGLLEMFFEIIQHVSQLQAINPLSAFLACWVSRFPPSRFPLERESYLRVSVAESYTPHDLIHYPAVSHGIFASRNIVVTALGRIVRTAAHHATARTQ